MGPVLRGFMRVPAPVAPRCFDAPPRDAARNAVVLPKRPNKHHGNRCLGKSSGQVVWACLEGFIRVEAAGRPRPQSLLLVLVQQSRNLSCLLPRQRLEPPH